jgi:hypothetical protein
MSKIAIAGDRVVVTSSVTLENLKLVEKHRPDALRLKDDDGNTTFALGVGSNSINSNGVSYAKVTYDEDGFATATTVIPEGVEDPKDYIVDTFGPTLEKLNQIEGTLPDIIDEINLARDTVRESITTV